VPARDYDNLPDHLKGIDRDVLESGEVCWEHGFWHCEDCTIRGTADQPAFFCDNFINVTCTKCSASVGHIGVNAELIADPERPSDEWIDAMSARLSAVKEAVVNQVHEPLGGWTHFRRELLTLMETVVGPAVQWFYIDKKGVRHPIDEVNKL
jgi:hypothetical protein